MERTRQKVKNAPTIFPRLKTWPTPTPAPAEASSCGKVIIVGEHAVVYGARAVAVPLLSMQTSIRLTPLESSTRTGAVDIRMSLGESQASGNVLGTVTDAFDQLGIKPFSTRLEASTSILIGAGLGSSASLSVGLLRVIARSSGQDFDNTDLVSMANALECRFHGNPSGLDVAVVAMERPVAFSRSLGVRELVTHSQPFRFVLIDSGVRASTLAMIKIAEPYFRARQGERRLAVFERLAKEAEEALRTGDCELLGGAMDEASAMLKEAGVNSGELLKIVETVKKLGVRAAKPTGAGGGGCVLCLLDNHEFHRQMKSLKEAFGGDSLYEVVYENNSCV